MNRRGAAARSPTLNAKPFAADAAKPRDIGVPFEQHPRGTLSG